jgi:hypothetical protein
VARRVTHDMDTDYKHTKKVSQNIYIRVCVCVCVLKLQKLYFNTDGNIIFKIHLFFVFPFAGYNRSWHSSVNVVSDYRLDGSGLISGRDDFRLVKRFSIRGPRPPVVTVRRMFRKKKHYKNCIKH